MNPDDRRLFYRRIAKRCMWMLPLAFGFDLFEASGNSEGITSQDYLEATVVTLIVAACIGIGAKIAYTKADQDASN
jgi:hypothetical protein